MYDIHCEEPPEAGEFVTWVRNLVLERFLAEVKPPSGAMYMGVMANIKAGDCTIGVQFDINEQMVAPSILLSKLPDYPEEMIDISYEWQVKVTWYAMTYRSTDNGT